jgi:hypothetical protein
MRDAQELPSNRGGVMKHRLRTPSPALVISLIALFVALGGTSLAATKVIAAKHKHRDAKADTRLVRKLAPKLSVKHAKTASNAANATHATSADTAINASNATSATSAGVINGGDVSNLVSGYATITAGTTPAVKNFGGKLVNSVTVSRLGAGSYQVTFHGTFPNVTSIGQVATFASMWDSNTFDVASASNDQSSVSSNAISIRVFTWQTQTSPATLDDRDFSLMIMTP